MEPLINPSANTCAVAIACKTEHIGTVLGGGLPFYLVPSGLKGAGTPGGAQGTARPGKHIQVRAGKEHV